MRLTPTIPALALLAGMAVPVLAQQNQAVITLERTTCFGACPAYLLRIDSSGAVSFKQGPPANRRGERTSTITPDQFRDLVQGFSAIHFFELNDIYPERFTDGPTTHIGFTFEGKSKTITESESGPAELRELERTIERVTNIHRWLHTDTGSFSLSSPVADPLTGLDEDLKNDVFVRQDVYARIKPGMNRLMQAAGQGNVAEVRRLLQEGADVNAADETGWTALMIAAVAAQPQSVSMLLDAGARVYQRDRHGDTALIGAAAVRSNRPGNSAECINNLLARGAAIEAVNDLGESALMWAARAGNSETIRILLNAGADPTRVDRSRHDALFYLRKARDGLTFDRNLVERYNQAESILTRRP